MSIGANLEARYYVRATVIAIAWRRSTGDDDDDGQDKLISCFAPQIDLLKTRTEFVRIIFVITVSPPAGRHSGQSFCRPMTRFYWQYRTEHYSFGGRLYDSAEPSGRVEETNAYSAKRPHESPKPVFIALVFSTCATRLYITVNDRRFVQEKNEQSKFEFKNGLRTVFVFKTKTASIKNPERFNYNSILFRSSNIGVSVRMLEEICELLRAEFSDGAMLKTLEHRKKNVFLKMFSIFFNRFFYIFRMCRRSFHSRLSRPDYRVVSGSKLFISKIFSSFLIKIHIE